MYEERCRPQVKSSCPTGAPCCSTVKSSYSGNKFLNVVRKEQDLLKSALSDWRTLCSEMCQGEICPDDLVCCKPQNTTHTACCRQIVDQTFYSIGVVTRKLSGILILLLLFTLGYVFHRLLCARARTQTPSHQQGLQTITASQELLVDSCTPDIDGSIDLLPHLPTYDECKQLPTYEETVRDGGRESGNIQPGCYMDTPAIYNNQQRKVFQSACDV